MGFIYIIKNTIDNKCYIGQTTCKNVNTRWKSHIRRMNTDGCPALYSAFRKYGIDKFEFKVLCECNNEDCDKLEIQYIIEYNSIAPNGYNIESGGNKNKVFHPETCEKIKKALTGKKLSDETKGKISKANTGKRHTEESKQKMSIKRKGWKMSEESRKKQANTIKGHPVSELTRQRVAESNKKRVWTDEMRQKMSISSKNRNIKSVGKFSLDNIFIERFESIKEAAEKCSASRQNISNCCNGRAKTHKKFIWKFL